MGKDDIYFIVGTVLAILALFGTDWNIVRGRLAVSMKPNRWREILVLLAVIGSLVFSGIGWYRYHLWPVSINDVPKITPRDFPTVATAKLSENSSGWCSNPEARHSESEEKNIFNCFITKRGDGKLRVILIFDHPLQYGCIRVTANGERLSKSAYSLQSSESVPPYGRRFGPKINADIVIGKDLAEKKLRIEPFNSDSDECLKQQQ
jgi:hypothetical protein